MTRPSAVLDAAAVSGAPTAALLLAVAGSALVLMEDPATSRWLGAAPDTGLFLSVLSFAVGGCLFAVVGYLTGSRWSRDRGYALRRSVPSPVRVVVVSGVGDLVWLVGTLLLVHAVAYGRSVVLGASSPLPAWPLSLLGLVAATSCYAVAAVVGAALRTPFGVALVAPAPYAATLLAGEVALSSRPELQQLVAPFVDQTWFPNLVPDPLPLLALAAYCAAVTAAAGVGLVVLLGVRLHVPRPRTATALVPLAAVLVTAGIVASGWSPNGFARTDRSGAVCSPDGRVCVWGSSRTVLPVVVAAERRVRAAVERAGTPADLRFAQYGLADDDGTTVVVETAPAHVDEADVRRQMVAAYAQRWAAPCTGTADDVTLLADLHAALLRAVEEGTSDDLGPALRRARAC
ncbi:MAG: hypothetical protein J7503_16760 [Cellulomonas iranensis]|uniref:hypothetical protein n=1 Tax=Cellulomonas iranensis TaxID=76862 RepID=UPI001B204300|nr:hypothetical protein [Cellulomonas iranensis]MBO9570457.1 hypothetical protein [Cellulomonas iranensis]